MSLIFHLVFVIFALHSIPFLRIDGNEHTQKHTHIRRTHIHNYWQYLFYYCHNERFSPHNTDARRLPRPRRSGQQANRSLAVVLHAAEPGLPTYSHMHSWTMHGRHIWHQRACSQRRRQQQQRRIRKVTQAIKWK